MELLTFHLGDREFAVDLSRVQEIISPLPITRVPGVPPALLGLFGLRGEPTAVVDAGLRLAGRRIAITGRTPIVVLHATLDDRPVTFGLLVEAAGRKLTVEEFLPFTDSLARVIGDDPCVGFADVGGALVLHLDVDRLLRLRSDRATEPSAPPATVVPATHSTPRPADASPSPSLSPNGLGERGGSTYPSPKGAGAGARGGSMPPPPARREPPSPPPGDRAGTARVEIRAPQAMAVARAAPRPATVSASPSASPRQPALPDDVTKRSSTAVVWAGFGSAAALLLLAALIVSNCDGDRTARSGPERETRKSEPIQYSAGEATRSAPAPLPNAAPPEPPRAPAQDAVAVPEAAPPARTAQPLPRSMIVTAATPACEIHEVVKGDTLWWISAHKLGDPLRWPELFGENREKLVDPNVIEIHDRIRIPGACKPPTAR